MMYDYEICCGLDALKRMIEVINRVGYQLIAVTQFKDQYTVFFGVPANG